MVQPTDQPPPSRHQCCIRLALLAKRRAGKLILSAPGNALLDKDLIRRNRFVHLRELPMKVRSSIQGERFDIPVWKKVMVNRRF